MAVAFAEAPAAATTTEVEDLRLGIIGAGKFGTTVARAAVAAGYDVAISGSGPADEIALTIEVLAHGARAATTAEVVRHADVIVLAVPTHRFRELAPDLFAGKILIDAMNYWQPVDGEDPELTTASNGTSTVVQERFRDARVVKSLNQLGYHQLEENRRTKEAPDRIALGAAGDDSPPEPNPQGTARVESSPDVLLLTSPPLPLRPSANAALKAGDANGNTKNARFDCWRRRLAPLQVRP